MTTSINSYGLPNLVIPAEILFNDNLGFADKVLFAMIKNLTHNENMYCWASNSYLAKHMNLKKNTVSISLSKLEKNQYIHMTYSKREVDGATIRKIYINKQYQEIYSEMLKNKYKEIKNFLDDKKPIEKPGSKKEGGVSQKSNTCLTKIKQGTHKNQSNIDNDIDSDIETENHRFSLYDELNNSSSGTENKKRTRKRKQTSQSPTSMKDKINGKKKNKEHSAQSSTQSTKTPTYYNKANLDLIDIWNKQENLRSHKNQNSKTFIEALKKLDMLRKGTLHKKVNKDSLQEYVPESNLSAKWKKSQIAKAIKNLNEWCKEGNLPYKKDWIKKLSLGDAIFCSQYGSPLMAAFIKGVNPINDPTKKLSSDQEKDAYSRFEHFFASLNGGLTLKKKQQIVDLVKSLVGLREEHAMNWKQRDPADFGYGHPPNDLKSLTIDYIEFLSGKYTQDFAPNASLTPNGLKFGNYVWSQFEKAYRNRFGADPISGP